MLNVNKSQEESEGYKLGRVQVKPYLGEITELKVEALVQSTGTPTALRPVSMSQWVREAEIKGEIAAELQRHAPLTLGDVIVTSAGRLPARYLLHAVVIDWASGRGPAQLMNDSIVMTTAKKCVSLAAMLGVKSLAFTPWGTAIKAYKPDYATTLMVAAILQAVRNEPGELETVYLVSNEEEHYQWFVDRVLVFRILAEQMEVFSKAIAGLDMPAYQRERVMSVVQNVQNNVMIALFEDFVAGSKYETTIPEAKGIAIGDGASSISEFSGR